MARPSVAAQLFVGFALIGAQQRPAAEIQLRVVDEQTGFLLPPSAVTTSLPVTRTTATMTMASDAAGRTLSLSVAGYASKEVSLPASAAQVIEVRLQPNTPPPEFAAAFMRELEASGMIVVAGFVSDEAAGGPLSGVRVSLDGTETTRETNGRGFFSLSVRPPSNYSETEGIHATVRFEKPGYTTLERRNARLVTGSVRKYRIRMAAGSGVTTVDERASRTGEPEPEPVALAPATAAATAAADPTPPPLPVNVRVGLECPTSTTCKRVVITALEDYVRHVLPNEWIASWHPESLKAGAVAVRSVGVWFTRHPKGSGYDACSTTMCQVYDPDVTQSTTDAAVDATKFQVLVRKGTVIVEKSEFSSENNDAGCGDGKAGMQPPHCIDDAVCIGQKKFGHGRGMCQYGSNRWAHGKTVKNQPVAGGPRTSGWILSHYYPALEVRRGSHQ